MKDFAELLRSLTLNRVDAIVLKGKGTSGFLAEERYYAFQSAMMFTLNEDVMPMSALHFEIHSPRHHNTPEFCPTVIHWKEPKRRPNEFQFPQAIAPRQLYASSAGYMLATVFHIFRSNMLRLNTRLILAGLDYESAHERRYELGAILYWIGRLDERGVNIEPNSRILEQPYQ